MKSEFQFEIEVQTRCETDQETTLKNTAKLAAKTALEQLPESVLTQLDENQCHRLNIAFIPPDEMQTLNLRYRNKNAPTDVLSFSRVGTSEITLGNPEIESDIGDVVVCLEIAQRQAKENEVTLPEELARLVVHGVLHLFGYDHEEGEEEAKTMFALQEQILSKL